MRIKLLNNAGYNGLDNVAFPVEVDATAFYGGADIASAELYRIGAEPGSFDGLGVWCFSKQHYEVL